MKTNINKAVPILKAKDVVDAMTGSYHLHILTEMAKWKTVVLLGGNFYFSI